MPCFDPWPWQPQHPGGAIWLREGKEGVWGVGVGGLETIKVRCASLIVLSIKVLVGSGLNRTSSLDPVTRHRRADGTSISSCGWLLKWLTSGYHLKYDIINAWVGATSLTCPWTCLFQQEHRVFGKKRDLNGWLLVWTGRGPPTAGHCISLLPLVGTDGSLNILSSHIFCTIYCLTVSAGIFIVFTFLKHLYSESWRFLFFIFYHPMVNSYFSPILSFIFYIVLIQRYTTFQEFSSTLSKREREKKNKPKWIFSKTIYGIF